VGRGRGGACVKQAVIKGTTAWGKRKLFRTGNPETETEKGWQRPISEEKGNEERPPIVSGKGKKKQNNDEAEKRNQKKNQYK